SVSIISRLRLRLCPQLCHPLVPSFSSPLFFFLMLPRPPRSTLFPYTALFRSWWPTIAEPSPLFVQLPQVVSPPAVEKRPCGSERSEEHTSELQTRGHIVCRLLLEKKKR